MPTGIHQLSALLQQSREHQGGYQQTFRTDGHRSFYHLLPKCWPHLHSVRCHAVTHQVMPFSMLNTVPVGKLSSALCTPFWSLMPACGIMKSPPDLPPHSTRLVLLAVSTQKYIKTCTKGGRLRFFLQNKLFGAVYIFEDIAKFTQEVTALLRGDYVVKPGSRRSNKQQL